MEKERALAVVPVSEHSLSRHRADAVVARDPPQLPGYSLGLSVM